MTLQDLPQELQDRIAAELLRTMRQDMDTSFRWFAPNTGARPHIIVPRRKDEGVIDLAPPEYRVRPIETRALIIGK